MADEIREPENQDLPGEEPEIEEPAEPDETLEEEVAEDSDTPLDEEKPEKPAKKPAGEFETWEEMEQAYFRKNQELNEMKRAKPAEPEVAKPQKTAEEIRDQIASEKYFANAHRLALLKNPELDEDTILQIASQEARDKAEQFIEMQQALYNFSQDLEAKTSPEWGEIQRLKKDYPELSGFNNPALSAIAKIISKEKGMTAGDRTRAADRATADGQKARARTLSAGRDTGGKPVKATATKQEYEYYAQAGLSKADVDKYNAAQKGGKR